MSVLAPLLFFLLSWLAHADDILEDDFENIDIPGSGNNNESYRSEQNTRACATACSQLQSIPTLHLTSSTTNMTHFNLEKADFWSTFQSTISPSCFVSPSNAEEVSQILAILKSTNCTFAIKSGGHAAFQGASNADNGGITIQLKNLNTLELDEDSGVAKIGTGNLWINVYDFLTPKNLSAVGGRVTNIGVGGLTLGGGISFFSERYGWACDNVQNYEIVVASGEILQVSRETYPELFWALRGGGNNFGIVTRLDLEVFEQGDVWGGSVAFGWERKGDIVDAVYHFGQRQSRKEEADVDASIWAAFGYAEQAGGMFISIEPVYAKAVEEDPPKVFENFTRLGPSVRSTTKIRSLTDLSREVNQSNPNGLRETYWTHNYVLTKEIMGICLEIFEEDLEGVKSVEGIVPVMLFQPLSTGVIKHFAKNGGNALGITGEDGALLLMSIAIMWIDTSRDEEVFGFVRRVMKRCVERSREVGAWHPYIYQNYAAQEQKVFEGYGRVNLERLREVSKKWDPEGIFQRLQPGYHKLWQDGE